MKKSLMILGILIFFPFLVFAQKYEWLRGGSYDSSIPTPESVLGYEIGAYFTDHWQAIDYMRKLEAAAKDRVKVFKYGQSSERRELIIVAIGTPQNIQRLEEIRTTIERLGDPRKTGDAEAETIIKQIPPIGWLNFGTDGNESTAMEASIQLAYQLVAGTDALTKKIRDDLVIIINPMASPDSCQRYVTWMKAAKVGKNGSPSPDASEHHGDWLMDTNQTHFSIDFNRDAFALSEKETQALADVLHHWNPQIWIDNHGTPNEYFFAPYCTPVNLNFPPTHLKWATEIGKNNARYFDQYGWTFMKDENYDLYYPGYWDSYPSFNGAVGVTYETDGGGNKGLVYEIPDKTRKTLRDGIHHHFMTNMSSLEILANNKENILRDFYLFRKTAMEEADKDKFKSYVLIPGADEGRLNDLIGLFLRHKFEIFKADKAFSSQRAQTYYERISKPRNFPAGSYIIPLKQPQKRLVKTLLEPDPKMEDKFLKEMEDRVARDKKLGSNVAKEGQGFYDVTAWALPVTYGIDAAFAEDMMLYPKDGLVAKKPESGGTIVGGKAGYAYLFSYTTDAGAKLCGRLLQEGYKVALATRDFKNSGRDFPKGTLMARVQRNPETLHKRIEELAKECEADVYATNTAWADTGISPGSRYVTNLQEPKIMVLTHTPTSSTGFGGVWHLLEVRYGLDFTAVRAEYFAGVDLNKYNVIIFPDGQAAGYERLLGETGISNLKTWIRNGGTFIGIKGGAAFTTRKGIELTDIELVTEVADKDASNKKPIENNPGSIFRATVNNDYYLGIGYPEQIAVQVRGNYLFNKTKLGANVLSYPKNAFVMGQKWAESEEVIADRLYLADVPLGSGHVILFTEDPTFRNYWRGLDRLFLSAVLFSPAF